MKRRANGVHRRANSQTACKFRATACMGRFSGSRAANVGDYVGIAANAAAPHITMETTGMATANAVTVPRKLSAAELAEHFGVSRRHIENLAIRGIIPSYRLGARRVFSLSEVEAALRQQSQ